MPNDAHDRASAPGSTLGQRCVIALTRLGISLFGCRLLVVRGRKTGQPHSTPVNVLQHAGGRYLVAPRGQTQWVRNLRVAGEGRLRVGSRIEGFRAVELVDDAKPTVLRAYLARWRWQVGAFFDDLGPDSGENELRGRAADYPVFRLEVLDGT